MLQLGLSYQRKLAPETPSDQVSGPIYMRLAQLLPGQLDARLSRDVQPPVSWLRVVPAWQDPSGTGCTAVHLSQLPRHRKSRRAVHSAYENALSPGRRQDQPPPTAAARPSCAGSCTHTPQGNLAGSAHLNGRLICQAGWAPLILPGLCALHVQGAVGRASQLRVGASNQL